MSSQAASAETLYTYWPGPGTTVVERSAEAGRRSCLRRDSRAHDGGRTVAAGQDLVTEVMVSGRDVDMWHVGAVQGPFIAAIGACAEHTDLRERE